MGERTKIYFIGRKQGIGLRRFRLSHLENRRRFEPEGLKDAKSKIKQTRLIQNADVIWVRVRPEHTNDKQRHLIEERLKNIRGKKSIINDISIFNNYDCKDIAFGIWKGQGISCPDYLTIELEDAKNDLDQIIRKISKFLSQYEKIFLRTNNETASLGMLTLTNSTTKDEIKKSLVPLINRCEKHQLERSATRLMIVEFFQQHRSDQYADLYRVHVLFGKIISYYAVTNKEDIFHNIDMTMKEIDRFIMLNEQLPKIISLIEPEILKAVASLGCNLGAIEFFIENNKPIFIELNPMWGGHASIKGFGDKPMQSYLIDNRVALEERIPNIYNFMDYRPYYKRLYEYIHQHINLVGST